MLFSQHTGQEDLKMSLLVELYKRIAMKLSPLLQLVQKLGLKNHFPCSQDVLNLPGDEAVKVTVVRPP